ncbi:MAG: GGDEF domain-containing protein [Magnetococcus sp. WYHC-3]
MVLESVETNPRLASRDDSGQEALLGDPMAPAGDNSGMRSSSGYSAPAETLAPVESRPIVGSLLRRSWTVRPATLSREVAEAFKNDNELKIIPVLQEQRPVGVVHRSQFMSLFLSPFGHDLYCRKPIHRLMDVNPILLDYHLPLEKASRIITANQDLWSEYNFVIADGERYLGVGFILDLLRRITELQIQNARHANPLTGLPGNVPINDELNCALARGGMFVVAYCDLDNFKPFNDYYGYDKGDEVIRECARVLVASCDPRRDFLGHVGGDDFIVIYQSENWETRCREALEEFGRLVPALYNEQDREAGGIWGKDRQGNPVFFGFVSLSIGAVLPTTDQCRSHHDIATMAVHAKKMAKRIPGNSLFCDRRRGPTQPERFEDDA